MFREFIEDSFSHCIAWSVFLRACNNSKRSKKIRKISPCTKEVSSVRSFHLELQANNRRVKSSRLHLLVDSEEHFTLRSSAERKDPKNGKKLWRAKRQKQRKEEEGENKGKKIEKEISVWTQVAMDRSTGERSGQEGEKKGRKVDVSSIRKRLIRRDRCSLRCERLLHSNQYDTRTPGFYICMKRGTTHYRRIPATKSCRWSVPLFLCLSLVYKKRTRFHRWKSETSLRKRRPETRATCYSFDSERTNERLHGWAIDVDSRIIQIIYRFFSQFNRLQLLLLIFEIIHFDVRIHLNNFPLDSDSDTRVLLRAKADTRYVFYIITKRMETQIE